jgi:Chlorophyllase enzyme
MRRYVRAAVASGAVLAALTSVSAGAATRLTTTKVLGDTVVVVKSPGATSFAKAGPYAVGIVSTSFAVPATTLTPAGYRTTAVCWYPSTAMKGTPAIYNVESELPPLIAFIVSKNPAAATAATYSTGGITNAKPATGVFPLVLFSHGFSGFKYQSSTLMAHAASWGFVVCAPDHPGRDLESQLDSQVSVTPPTSDPNADVNDLIALHNWVATDKIALLKGHVDAKRVVVMGHSAGGSAAERLASWGTTQSVNWVKGWIGMAGMSNLSWSSTVAPFNVMPTEPGLVVAGDTDTIVSPTGLQTAFGALTGPKYFNEMLNAGHNVYSDLCMIGAGNGGILAIAAALGVPVPTGVARLAVDGCQSPDQPVTNSWPAINQMTVGAIRSFLGFDHTTKTFTNLHAAYPSTVQ